MPDRSTGTPDPLISPEFSDTVDTADTVDTPTRAQSLSPVDRFSAFIASVPCREALLPWGEARIWDLGSGRPVVFLHGITGGRRVFFRVAERLAERRRVVAPLLRGERAPSGRTSLEQHLDDVAALLAVLDLRDVTLFGFSFGGMLALAYGARNDPRVAEVVVQGTFTRYPLDWLDRAALLVAGAVPQSLGAWYFRRRVLRGRENRLLAQSAPGLDLLNAQWSAATPVRTLGHRARIIHAEEISERVRRIEAPLTLAHGTADPIVPISSFDHLRALRPDARAVSWKGVGHVASLTHPDEVAALMV